MGITPEEIEQRHQRRADLLVEDKFHTDAMEVIRLIQTALRRSQEAMALGLWGVISE